MIYALYNWDLLNEKYITTKGARNKRVRITFKALQNQRL